MECTNCRKPYGAKKVRTVPLLLKCGCTFCAQCIEQLSRQCRHIKCPNCRFVTSMSDEVKVEEQLSPHVYLLGLVAAQELGLTVCRETSWLYSDLALESPKKLLTTSNPGVQVQCEECVSAVADLRCLQCHGDFCTQCSAIVHSSSRALRSHHPLPINQALSAPQLCPNHPQQPKLHYCKEENEIICTECILNGIHKDHEVVTISHAARQFRRELKQGISSAQKVVMKIIESIETVKEILFYQKTTALQQAKELSLVMPTLHSYLQMREMALHQELVEAFDECVSPYSLIHQCLKEHRDLAEEYIKKGKDVIDDDFKLVKEAVSLSKKVNDIQQFPAVLEAKYNESIRFSLDCDSSVDWLQKLGDVSGGLQKPVLTSMLKKPFDYTTKVHHLPPPSSSLHPPHQRSKSSSPSARRPKFDTRSVSPAVMKSSRKTSPAVMKSSRKTSPALVLSQSHYQPNITPLEPLSPSAVEALDKIYVSHVNNPEEFYIQKKSQLPELEHLQRRLNQYCQENTQHFSEHQLKEGIQCGARYTTDNIWYRVVLDAIADDFSYVNVHYIDFGNSENLPPSRLCVLPPSLKIVPPFASCSCLYQIEPATKATNLAPANWKSSAISMMQEATQDSVRIKVFDQTAMGVHYVDLFIGPTYQSLRERLISSGVAVHARGRHVPVAIRPPFTLGVGDQLEISIPTAQNPWDFHILDASPCCQLVLSELEEKLEQADQKGSLQVLGTPVVGMWACTRFKEDQKLYRAKIEGVSEDGIRVKYFDFGNEETVPLDEVYRLPEDVISVPIQAVQCQLHDVRPPLGESEWPEDCSDFFHSIAGGSGLKMIVKSLGQPLPVQVTITESNLNVSEILVKEGKAAFVPSSSSTPIKHQVTPSHQPTSTTNPASDPLVMKSPLNKQHVNPPPGFLKRDVISTLPISTSPIADISTPPAALPDISIAALPTAVPHTPPSTPPGSPSDIVEPSDVGSASPVIATTSEEESVNEMPIITTAAQTIPLAPLPAVGSSFTCQVVNINSMDLFFVWQMGRDQETNKLKTILSQLQEQELGPLDEVLPGQPALAKYDNSWHRVVYLREDAGHTVLYVDYGNVDKVEILAPMPEDLCKIPRQAIACSLQRGTRGIVNGEASMEEFCTLVYNQKLTAVVEDMSDCILKVSLSKTQSLSKTHFLLA